MRGPSLAAVLPLLLGAPALSSSEPREPLEAALLRSVQIGSLQVEAAAALRHARDPETTSRVMSWRGRPSRWGKRDLEFAEWPLARLLQRALDLLTASPGAWR